MNIPPINTEAVIIPGEPDALDLTYAIAEAVATHPEGTALDANGNPISDVPDAE